MKELNKKELDMVSGAFSAGDVAFSGLSGGAAYGAVGASIGAIGGPGGALVGGMIGFGFGVIGGVISLFDV